MDSMYGDDGPSGPPPAQGKQSPDESDSPAAVLPKSILMGKEFKPGEEIVLQITRVNEDSVEVKYASNEESEDESKPDVGNPEPMGSMADSGGGGDMYS